MTQSARPRQVESAALYRYNHFILRTLPGFVLALPLLAAPPFTLDQVLSSPFPSDLTASPAGDAVAWVQNARGVRNVWVASSPEWTGAPITRFSADDGQEIDEIAWKADSSALFFTRGGSANSRGEYPNPRSDPAGVRQEIWMAGRSGEPRRLADGHSPAPAPDGSVLTWIYGGQIWSCSLSGEPKPSQLVHARGLATDLVWSPRGQRLAFSSDRGDHAFIGVYDISQKTLSFMEPSVDTDQFPAWSPDGTQLAFIRIPANRYASSYGAKRTGQPWSIRLADASTGKGREVWRARQGMGSVFWPLALSRQLQWSADGRILFPWEGDGWLHLYSVDPALGAAATLLTQGSFEVEHAALGIDGREIVYSSNQNDADRRHLWTVRSSGGTAELLTAGTGIEWAPAVLIGGRIALLHSTARLPARAAILERRPQIRDLSPNSMPGAFPSAALVEPQAVIFPAADGMSIHGQLFLPSAEAKGKHPAVVFFHGGSRRQMYLGWHSMFYYHQAYAFNQYLAARGYVVLSVNYRSGIGYGEEFREATGFGPTGATEFNDVKGAGLYLRSRGDVDPARIGVWGGSYGGYLTALGLARASEVFAAGVDLHGVHDWNLEISNPLPAYQPEERLAVSRLAFESSPMSAIAAWRSPVLLIQGDDDRNVPFAETVQLAEALSKKGVHVEQLIFPDEIHDFLVFAHWLQAYEAAAAFLDRYLGL